VLEQISSSPLILAFTLVFLAELGDKTQLIALAFATRYPLVSVLTGVLIGTALVTALSVALGGTVGEFLPQEWLKIATGIILIVFAILIVREGEEEEEDVPTGVTARFGPVAGVAFTFVIAEMGDKTMIATMALAAQTRMYLMVWAGATVGMVLANLIGIAIGRFAGRRLPERTIRWVAGTLFFASGAIILIDGIRGLAT
jgi:Ca2+/H+ antiporter, TMEM165/GDT1 family